MALFTTSYAVFSKDSAQTYRYVLGRHWSRMGRCALFIMLNPSTADGQSDDMTIKKCRHFASSQGCGGFKVCNLFAYRSTFPMALALQRDPVGPDNDQHLRHEINSTLARRSPVIVAWGAYQPDGGRRAKEVLALLRQSRVEVLCLGFTRVGYPKHPCRLPHATTLQVFPY